MPDMEFVDSTNVEAIGYDASVEEVHVRFLESGETYVYMGVPEPVYDEFRIAPSKGSFVNRRLRGTYEFRKE